MLLKVPKLTHERSHIIRLDKTAVEAKVFLWLGKFKQSNSAC
jgi:hypothetical protein